jgi:hypothetical protein
MGAVYPYCRFRGHSTVNFSNRKWTDTSIGFTKCGKGGSTKQGHNFRWYAAINNQLEYSRQVVDSSRKSE